MRHPLTVEIYKILMVWMEENFDSPILKIPLPNTNYGRSYIEDTFDLSVLGYKPRIIGFNRIVGDNNRRGVSYKFKNGTEKIIWYDPNWELYYTIEKILEDE